MLRILIIEDSSVVAMLLKAIFQQQSDMQVVGLAKDGREGLKMALELKPDVITMDIRMPIMDGFEATRLIMAEYPVPIVVISSSVDDEELRITFRAIEEGALTVMEKPRGFTHPDFGKISRDLVDTVRSMSQVKLFKRQKFSPSKPVTPKQIQRPEVPSPHYGNQCELLAIGCSTGGPQALHKIFSLLPMSFPVPIVVTQHISLGFVGGLVSWLASNTLLKVKIAEQGESLLAGTIYFAPDDQHLMISRSFGNLAVMINSDAPCNGFRPSVNTMFNSVAQTCKNRALGALLTGMGTDGADGLLALRRAGSHTLVQDDASAVVYGMPGAAIAIDAADKVVALDDMSAYFSSMVRR